MFLFNVDGFIILCGILLSILLVNSKGIARPRGGSIVIRRLLVTSSFFLGFYFFLSLDSRTLSSYALDALKLFLVSRDAFFKFVLPSFFSFFFFHCFVLLKSHVLKDLMLKAHGVYFLRFWSFGLVCIGLRFWFFLLSRYQVWVLPVDILCLGLFEGLIVFIRGYWLVNISLGKTLVQLPIFIVKCLILGKFYYL